MSSTCPLSYPERFHAARAFVQKGTHGLHEESKLLLYALEKQSLVGPCNEPKPWGWNVVNNAKTLEEEVSEWWSPELMEEEIFKSADMSDGKQEEEQEGLVRIRLVLNHVVKRGHASALLGSVMYMIGGGNNTKGCADMYALDLKNFGSDPLEWVLVGNTPAEAAIASEGQGQERLGGRGNRESSKSLASKDSEPLEEAEASKREAAARKEANSLEVSIMRKQLESANEAVQKAEKLAAAAREALSEEEQKNMHLQVEIAELKKEAAKVKELESELQRYREREEMNGKPKTSLWGYIAGSDAAAK
eukprot:jgi/Picre1/32474/NNA_007820.t1